MRYVQVKKFCETTGYTDKAVRRKMQEGVWIEGQHYRKAPDGHIMIDVEGYERWVEGRRALSKSGQPASGSSSRISVAAA